MKPGTLMNRLAFALPILICASVSTAANAQTQEPPAREPLIRTQVNEVRVPVVVTDAHGRHIAKLKSSDFQVFEDGKPQRVVAFQIQESLPGSLEASDT